jgi:hypothetical protein
LFLNGPSVHIPAAHLIEVWKGSLAGAGLCKHRTTINFRSRTMYNPRPIRGLHAFGFALFVLPFLAPLYLLAQNERRDVPGGNFVKVAAPEN